MGPLAHELFNLAHEGWTTDSLFQDQGGVDHPFFLFSNNLNFK